MLVGERLSSFSHASYDNFQVLHDLWQSYLADLMGDKFDLAKLLKADLHGAKLKGASLISS